MLTGIVAVVASGAVVAGVGGLQASANLTDVVVNDGRIGTQMATVAYSGRWIHQKGLSGHYGGDNHFTWTRGSAASMPFDGVGVAIYGSKAKDYGRFAVRMDGAVVATIDAYAATRADNRLLWRSAVLTPGRHTVRIEALGTRNAASSGTTINLDRFVVTPSAEPAPAVPDFDTSWTNAWATKDHETLRTWFNAHVTGPKSTNGTATGGSISTQAQADALRGKVVTGDLTVNGNVSLRDFVLRRAVMTVLGGNVKVANVWFDAQKKTTSACGYLNIKGRSAVELHRVKMTGIPDGIRMTNTPSLKSRYLYIADPATVPSCNGHHDGIQVMGGSAVNDRAFIDMTGGPSSGQGVLVKADSADIKTFAYTNSFLTGGGNSMTFQPTRYGFPDTIDLSGMLVARGFTRGLFSIYQTNAAQTAMVTRYSVTASPSGKVIAIRNGILAGDL